MSLYGAFVETSHNPRMVYERLDQPGKVASVNHVTRTPQDATELFDKEGKKHTEYVPIGKYLGADTPDLFDKLQRRKGTKTSKTSSSLPKRVNRH